MGLLETLFEQNFLSRAMIAGAMVGLVCSVTGVFVVLRGLAFISAGISHSAFAGVALGLLLGVNPLFAAFVFCSLIAIMIGKVSDIGRIREDTSIGIFLAASMALGVLILNFVTDPSVDLIAYLFGSILSLSQQDLFLTLIISIIVLLPLLLFNKEFMLIVFDEEQAAMVGIPTRLMTYLLLVLLAVATVISIKIVGIILATALIVAPAASALQLTKDFDRALVISAILGITSVQCGIILSFYLDTAPGATITMVSTVVFFISLAVRRIFR